MTGGNFALAQEEYVEVGSDGSTTHEENGPSCDDICANKVSEVTSAAIAEEENLRGEINNLRGELARLEQQLREAWEAKDHAYGELDRERGEMEGAKRECYGEVDSWKQKVGQVEASLEASNKQSAQLAGELFETKESLAEFQQQKFFINTKLIKSDLEKTAKQFKEDVTALLKKYGIIKD